MKTSGGPHLFLTLPWRGRVGLCCAQRDASRGGVRGEQGRIDRLRMNNHPTPAISDKAALRPIWPTLPLEALHGKVRKFFAIANLLICNRTTWRSAKRLRASTTPHERALWCAIKELPTFGTHFRRQAPIGPYVVDFFCPAAHLIIEIDGGHHNDDDTAERDLERQLWLEREGYRVIRFWNSDITNELTPCWNGFTWCCMVRARLMPGA